MPNNWDGAISPKRLRYLEDFPGLRHRGRIAKESPQDFGDGLVDVADKVERGEASMVHSVATDRRQGRRYLVVGMAVISTAKDVFQAELVNIGEGGMLAFCDAPLSLGERVDVRFQV